MFDEYTMGKNPILTYIWKMYIAHMSMLSHGTVLY